MRQKKLYQELIQKDIDALERKKSNKIKKNNIFKILENINANIICTMESCLKKQNLKEVLPIE